MGNRSTVSREEAERAIRVLEERLQEGHIPRIALNITSRMVGWPQSSTRYRLGTPDNNGYLHRIYGLKPDWSKYQPPPLQDVGPLPPPEPPPPPPDPVRERAARDERTELIQRLREAERRAYEAETRQRSLLGLLEEPLQPRIIMPKREEIRSTNRTVLLHLSDIQYGETVKLEEMDGLNRYDSDVAQARLGRYFTKAAELVTEHWKGDPPDEIILCLGGDLISGSIHEELEITDFPTLPRQVKEVGEHIAGGILTLRDRVQRPIRVYSVPGNHGRTSKKPRAKHRAISSLDLLATDFCEAAVRGAGVDGVAFYQTHSPDAHFSTYGWHWLLTHGDTMGSRGGKGFIGAIAVIVRGHQKLSHTSWRGGKAVHYILTGDLHTTCKTPWGYGNGSVAGYNEYARDLRADPEPARQNMLVVHPFHGVINEIPIYLGSPDEGSLYAGPTSVVRPSPEVYDELEAL